MNHTHGRETMYEQQYAQSAKKPSMQGNSITAVGRPRLLESTIKSLTDLRSQVTDLGLRARSIADAVFGPMPATDSGSPAPPLAMCDVNAIEQEVRWLNETISELRIQIDRLTCI